MRMILILFASAISIHALQIEKVDFPDQVELGKEKLVLNGAGLRTKRRFGINFRVYVAGLYIPKKTTDGEAIIKSTDSAVIELVFLRSVDEKTLREGYKESFDKNCRVDCGDKSKENLKLFTAIMSDVKPGSRVKFIFDKKGVSAEVHAKEVHKSRLDDLGFRQNLMAAFIGEQPPNPELKKGLLGQ